MTLANMSKRAVLENNPDFDRRIDVQEIAEMRESRISLCSSGLRWLKSIAAILLVSFVHFSSRPVAAETPNLPPEPTFRDCTRCPEMVVVPSGRVSVGSSSEYVAREIEAASSHEKPTVRNVLRQEQPPREVTIAHPFAIGKYPITKDEFSAFVDESGYAPAPGCVLYSLQYAFSPNAGWRSPGFTQSDQDPVVCVSWHDAQAYVRWLNKKLYESNSITTPDIYRLPSEAEWEYAARANTQTSRWWGDSIGFNNANCARCGSKWDQARTAPVGSFRSNPFGLNDVLGNVTQWTEDCWNETYVDLPINGLPQTSGSCERRAARGGSWAGFPWVVRSAMRFGLTSESRTNLTGFRVARSMPPKAP